MLALPNQRFKYTNCMHPINYPLQSLFKNCILKFQLRLLSCGATIQKVFLLLLNPSQPINKPLKKVSKGYSCNLARNKKAKNKLAKVLKANSLKAKTLKAKNKLAKNKKAKNKLAKNLKAKNYKAKNKLAKNKLAKN